jgi:hypothetical protein
VITDGDPGHVSADLDDFPAGSCPSGMRSWRGGIPPIVM